jgi:hypothetical protein
MVEEEAVDVSVEDGEYETVVGVGAHEAMNQIRKKVIHLMIQKSITIMSF